MSGYQPDGFIDEFATAGGTDAADEFAAVLMAAADFLLGFLLASGFSSAFFAGTTRYRWRGCTLTRELRIKHKRRRRLFGSRPRVVTASASDSFPR